MDEVTIPTLYPIKQSPAARQSRSILSEGSTPNSRGWALPAQVQGKRIALGFGSRGIARNRPYRRGKLVALVKTALAAMPFIVPAMGSHGGATPEGQIDVLDGLGINEKRRWAVPYAPRWTWWIPA